MTYFYFYGRIISRNVSPAGFRCASAACADEWDRLMVHRAFIIRSAGVERNFSYFIRRKMYADEPQRRRPAGAAYRARGKR